MTPHDALLAAVLASPADDLPRLVYADWLEEHSSSERAEFIRVQCELAREDAVAASVTPMLYNVDYRNALRRRERELWVVVNGVIADSCPGTNQVFNTAPEFGTTAGVFDVRRGFVSEIRCRLADWCGGQGSPPRGHQFFMSRPDAPFARLPIGPRLVREHPVEKVVLTDAFTRSAVQGRPFVAVTRRSAGPLFDVAFPNSFGGHIEGHAEVIEDRISAAAIEWAKAQSEVNR